MSMDPIKTFESALKINRPAAVFVVGGFLVLALAAALGNSFKDSGLTFWHIPGALVGFSVLVAVLARLQGLLATLVCWTLVGLGLIWAVAVTGQIIFGNTLPYAKLECLTGFWKPGACSVSPIEVPQGEATVVTPDASLQPPASEDTELPPATAVDVDRGTAVTYIQFAGFDRDKVKEIARQLVDLGWDIQGAEQGGERYDHAAGLNEVRFFNAADKTRAEVLAQELSAAMSGRPITVLDVSDSSYAMDTPGHLEIWISK
jgi:hypothetical protein